MIVGDNENQRQLFNGGEIESLVKRPRRSRAIAKAHGADCPLDTAKSPGEQRTSHDIDYNRKLAQIAEQNGFDYALSQIRFTAGSGPSPISLLPTRLRPAFH